MLPVSLTIFSLQPGEKRIGEDGCGNTPLLYSWLVSGIMPSGGEPVPLNISGVSAGKWEQDAAIQENK